MSGILLESGDDVDILCGVDVGVKIKFSGGLLG